MFRQLITLFLVLALGITAAQAELTVISTQHRDVDSFKRFSEYLTGKPSDGRYAVYRSDEDSRDGFYVSLLVRDKDTLPAVSSLKVQFVRAGTQEVDSFESPAGTLKKKRILVGFTGNEWQDPSAHPVAWKIDLLDSSGQPLESAQSFLWSE